jgi:multicomponent Na+:H+ antiporter subunit A
MGAHHFTRFTQTGELRHYIRATFVVVAAALLWPLAYYGQWPNMPSFPDLMFYEWIVVGFAIAGVGLVLTARSRLVAIVSLGVQGTAVAMIFLLFGAPDLAFTQFMVETLSVVILTLVLTRLQLDIEDPRRPIGHLRDGSIALLCGAGFGLLLLSVTQGALSMHLSEFFNTYSYQIAHGRNIVNVILVDFRGVDTFGEIVVVLTAALACRALIRLRPSGQGA